MDLLLGNLSFDEGYDGGPSDTNQNSILPYSKVNGYDDYKRTNNDNDESGADNFNDTLLEEVKMKLRKLLDNQNSGTSRVDNNVDGYANIRNPSGIIGDLDSTAITTNTINTSRNYMNASIGGVEEEHDLSQRNLVKNDSSFQDPSDSIGSLGSSFDPFQFLKKPTNLVINNNADSTAVVSVSFNADPKVPSTSDGSDLPTQLQHPEITKKELNNKIKLLEEKSATTTTTGLLIGEQTTEGPPRLFSEGCQEQASISESEAAVSGLLSTHCRSSATRFSILDAAQSESSTARSQTPVPRPETQKAVDKELEERSKEGSADWKAITQNSKTALFVEQGIQTPSRNIIGSTSESQYLSSIEEIVKLGFAHIGDRIDLLVREIQQANLLNCRLANAVEVLSRKSFRPPVHQDPLSELPSSHPAAVACLVPDSGLSRYGKLQSSEEALFEEGHDKNFEQPYWDTHGRKSSNGSGIIHDTIRSPLSTVPKPPSCPPPPQTLTAAREYRSFQREFANIKSSEVATEESHASSPTMPQSRLNEQNMLTSDVVNNQAINHPVTEDNTTQVSLPFIGNSLSSVTSSSGVTTTDSRSCFAPPVSRSLFWGSEAKSTVDLSSQQALLARQRKGRESVTQRTQELLDSFITSRKDTGGGSSFKSRGLFEVGSSTGLAYSDTTQVTGHPKTTTIESGSMTCKDPPRRHRNPLFG